MRDAKESRGEKMASRAPGAQPYFFSRGFSSVSRARRTKLAKEGRLRLIRPLLTNLRESLNFILAGDKFHKAGDSKRAKRVFNFDLAVSVRRNT